MKKVLDGLEYTLLGTISEKPVFTAGGGEIETDSLIEAWKAPLEKVFPSKGKVMDRRQRDIPLYTARHEVKTAGDKFAKPRIFIPVFPGTNCEVDSARAFEKAGGAPEILVVKNLTPSDIEDTIDKMAAMIRNSQIIMFPGGFSGGDEPDGSGKFIATTFRNPKIMEAVTDLLENRDGLMLGICNGFQAMIKLGLVPYGKIVDTAEDDPTLTFNTLGRHISTMAYTRITSVKSRGSQR